ncbi:TniQ family protein [Burkholderia cenocepacia]|uniref:TniQ family protein n=2 Tax=Burkholderia cenocepacia TaxID=95486 RepID=UPI0028BD1CBF|nr:TniQ family protein [Burkholderia cenocepacia]
MLHKNHFSSLKGMVRIDRYPAPRLIGSPSILIEEAISGWIHRVCMYHGIKPGALIRRWGFNGPTSALDFTPIDPSNLKIIASTTMSSVEDIDEATYLDHTILGRPKFSCLINDFSAFCPIYRYCPACLGGDEVPYFRLSWRFAYKFVCEIHRCPLLDTCVYCARRIDLTWRFPRRPNSVKISDTSNCNYCSKPLYTAPSDPICDEIANQMIIFQRWFHDKVRLGGVSERGIPEFAPMFVARYLRSVPSERSLVRCFVGLDMDKLFGRDWQDLAAQIPCMRSSGRMVPEESA